MSNHIGFELCVLDERNIEATNIQSYRSQKCLCSMNAPQVYGPTRLIYEAYVAMLRLCLSNKQCRYLQTYTQTLMLTQCSIVVNLFDRVCAYLFQFKAFVAYTIRRQRTKLKQFTRHLCSCRDERYTDNQNCFPVGMYSHTNHFESSAFLQLLSKFYFIVTFFFLKIHLNQRLSMTSQKDKGTYCLTHRNKSHYCLKMFIEKFRCNRHLELTYNGIIP